MMPSKQKPQWSYISERICADIQNPAVQSWADARKEEDAYHEKLRQFMDMKDPKTVTFMEQAETPDSCIDAGYTAPPMPAPMTGGLRRAQESAAAPMTAQPKPAPPLPPPAPAKVVLRQPPYKPEEKGDPSTSRLKKLRSPTPWPDPPPEPNSKARNYLRRVVNMLRVFKDS